MAIGGIVGSWIGSWLLRRISLGWLRWMFIALLIAVAVRMVLVVPVRGDRLLELDVLPILGMIALGIVIGIASGLFGIGGGVIMVPAFIALFGMSDLVAKGTSLAVMIPTAMSGTVANTRAGIVDLKVALIVGLAATVASFGGVAIAFLLPPEWSAWLFAALLVVAAVQLTVRADPTREEGSRGVTSGRARIAGWYDDEADAALLRYWDGSKWSPHTAPRPTDATDAADAADAQVAALFDRIEATTLRLPPRSPDEHTTVPLPPEYLTRVGGRR